MLERLVAAPPRRHRAVLVTFAALLPLAALAQPIPFTEEAVARGINYQTIPTAAFGHGVAFADLDSDGDPDVVALGRITGHVGIFENDGTGNFSDHTSTSGIPPIARPSGVTAGDYDGDGDLDLYFSNWLTADQLFRNDGGFAFTDVTAAVGLGDIGAGAGCTWGDYDGDDRLDLYLGNRTGTEEGMYVATEENRLYRNQADGTFADVLATAGMSGEYLTFQAVFFDYDRDGDADLYISNDKCQDRGTNRLWENTGGNFTEITESSNTGVCIDSMGVAVGDFDRNLRPDLYATNIPEGNPLLLNNGDGTFTESAATAGVASFAFGWGAMFLDYDNDGYQELYVCNADASNRLYDHDGTWPSLDVGPDAACDDAGASYGVAHADVDGDGDLDILVSNSPGSLNLFINHEGQTRRWVRFQVVGNGNNTFGIGTTVNLRTGNERQTREVYAGGNGYKSQSELTLHFGVDTTVTVDDAVARWPGGAMRLLRDIPTNQTWTLYPPAALGDGDRDGDADPDDFHLHFVGCYTGAVPGSLVQGCEMMDFDGDWDVDNGDVDLFAAAYDGPFEDCNDNGVTDLVDIIDGTGVDLNQDGRLDECVGVTPAGVVPDGGTGGLLLARGGGGAVDLAWSASCGGADTDYVIYTGQLGIFTDHAPETCSTGGATTWSLSPPAGSAYFLVVPRTTDREGSYGRDGVGNERPAAAASCLARSIDYCD